MYRPQTPDHKSSIRTTGLPDRVRTLNQRAKFEQLGSQTTKWSYNSTCI